MSLSIQGYSYRIVTVHSKTSKLRTKVLGVITETFEGTEYENSWYFLQDQDCANSMKIDQQNITNSGYFLYLMNNIYVNTMTSCTSVTTWEP